MRPDSGIPQRGREKGHLPRDRDRCGSSSRQVGGWRGAIPGREDCPLSPSPRDLAPWEKRGRGRTPGACRSAGISDRPGHAPDPESTRPSPTSALLPRPHLFSPGPRPWTRPRLVARLLPCPQWWPHPALPPLRPVLEPDPPHPTCGPAPLPALFPAPAGDRQLLAPPLAADFPAPHWAPPGYGPALSVTRPWPRPAPSTLIGFVLQRFLSSDWPGASPFRRSIGPLRPLSQEPAPRRGGVSRGARRGIGRRS